MGEVEGARTRSKWGCGAGLGDGGGDYVLDPGVGADGRGVEKREEHGAGVDAGLDEVECHDDWSHGRSAVSMAIRRIGGYSLSPFRPSAQAASARMTMMALGKPVSMKARVERASMLGAASQVGKHS
jgi:hypothetical protein